MRYLLVPLLLVFLALPRMALGETITWFASGQLTNVAGSHQFFWPGLTAGTPWSLTFDLDSNTPASRPAFNPPGCNVFSMGAATFTLGPHTYTHGGGTVRTNFGYPGCTESFDPDDPDGLITFLFNGPWAGEPGAWNLGLVPTVTLFSYYDLIATDGGLPFLPVGNPNPGVYGGWEHEAAGNNASFFGSFVPTALVSSTPVPEPATTTMFGLGLAALAARRRRHR